MHSCYLSGCFLFLGETDAFTKGPEKWPTFFKKKTKTSSKIMKLLVFSNTSVVVFFSGGRCMISTYGISRSNTDLDQKMPLGECHGTVVNFLCRNIMASQPTPP